MAPNLVTLSGLGFIVINFIVANYYNPNLDQDSPRWTFFLFACGMFLYQTFDGCDGIHARRTGQSGPLGELFDHSIDALNATLSLWGLSSAMKIGYSYRFLINQCLVLLNFYLSTWEEYHTHVLFLSECSGPVEGILAICIGLILTGILGSEVLWRCKILHFEWQGTEIEILSMDVVIGLSALGILYNLLATVENVTNYYSKCASLSQTNIHVRSKNYKRGVLPFLLYYASVFILVGTDSAFISMPFVLSIGFTMAFVVGRIIVAHLTRQAFPMWNLPTGIPPLQWVLYHVATAWYGQDPAACCSAIAWMGLGLSIAFHYMFFNDIIYEFTTYLDCYALSIKHPKTNLQ